MGAEHGADGDCGHGVFLFDPEAKQARVQLVPNVINRCESFPKWNSATAGTVTTELL